MLGARPPPARATDRTSSDRDRPGIELERSHCRAGETLAGRITGGGVPVRLVRMERGPQIDRSFVVAQAPVGPGGAFTIATPGALLPTAAGRRCSLSYLACAEVASGLACADVVVAASARPHLDVGSSRADRLLLNWDARHFHIEVTQADPRSGGTVAGRVHRDRPWRTGGLVVSARCEECWRPSVLTARGFSHWEWSRLWEEERALWLDPDASWAAFRFELPAGLPPAVEARTIAWRYELVVRRRVRHWFDETAALTLLLHEEPAPGSPPSEGGL